MMFKAAFGGIKTVILLAAAALLFSQVAFAKDNDENKAQEPIDIQADTSQAETGQSLGTKETIVTAKAGYGKDDAVETVDGNVIVGETGTKIRNVIIKGDLCITKAVAGGDVTLSGVVVEGTVYINGGGSNSIVIENTDRQSSHMEQVIVDKKGVAIRLNGGYIASLTFQSSGKLSMVDSKLDTVIIDTEDKVTLAGGISEIRLHSKGEVSLGKAKVKEFIVTAEAAGSKVYISYQATVWKAVAEGDAAFSGQGLIQKMEAGTSGVTAEKLPQKDVGAYKTKRVDIKASDPYVK